MSNWLFLSSRFYIYYHSSLYYVYIAPPALAAFSFPNLKEGERTSIMCSVTSGDPPITIQWYKDGRLIDDRSSLSFQIVSITEYVSTLIITRLDKYYSGNYTCKSSNTWSSTNYTATLMVRSKPTFALKPISKCAIVESSVIFDCQAQAFPDPVVRWKFASSASFTESIAILSNPRIHVLENGSLLIKTVSIEDEGNYYCEVTNGLGKAIEVTSYLKVYEPPKIRPSNNKSLFRRSEKAELSCHTMGSLPIYFKWYRGKELLDSMASNYQIREETSGKYKTTILTIDMVRRNDSGLFTCTAINYYGLSKAVIKVIVQEPSDPPSNLHILQIKSRSISISWSIGYTGNSAIIGFEMEYRTNTGKFSIDIVSIYIVHSLYTHNT